MKTINVGFDFDEPIYKWYDFAHQASIKAGIATLEHEPTSWAPHETYGCTLEEWIAVLDNEVLNGDMYHQPFDPEALRNIKRMYSRGYNIHIITARGSFGELGERIKQITKSEIIKQGLPYTTLNFSKDKVPLALALGLDYMIDDAPHNFTPLLEAGIDVFLLDERWNRDMTEVTWYDRRIDREPGDPRGRRVASTMDFCNLVMNESLLLPSARVDV